MTRRDRRTSRLHTLVLRLYPPQVRRRYEPEIRELLESSPRPLRDLADVARTAVRERISAMGSRRPSRAVRWTTSVTATVVMLVAPIALFGTALPWIAPVVGSVAGLLLTGRRARLLVTSAVLLLYVLPHLAQWAIGGPVRAPEAIGTATFAVAALLLASLPRARPAARAFPAAAAVGLLVLPPLATTVFAAVSDLARPWQSYWLVMSSRAPFEVDDQLVYYPALYTCCAFLLLAGLAQPGVKSTYGSGRPR